MDPTTTEAVQPPEGQGGAPGGAPYAEYLDRIPQELRGDVEPVFKDWDSSVTKRFQALSEAGKRWKPYEQAGLHEHDPQSLARLVEFAQMAEQDPDAYADWLRAQAQAAGILPSTPAPDDDIYVDPAIERLVEQRLGPLQQQVQQFEAWQQQQENARVEQEWLRRIHSRLDELGQEHGEFPKEFVAQHAMTYAGDPHTAVDRAFADYQRIRADVEKGVFASKLAQPGTPEVTGTPDAQPQAITSLKEAAAVATERLRQQNRAA